MAQRGAVKLVVKLLEDLAEISVIGQILNLNKEQFRVGLLCSS